jgi:signal peptidase I
VGAPRRYARVSSIRRLIFGANPRRTFVRIAVLAVISLGVFRWVLLPVRAEGISMEPTYQSGSFRLVNRLAFSTRPPARGDVVAIRLAGRRVVYVKRIVGLPGERLGIVEGVVHIDDRPLDEPYVRHRRAWDLDEVTIGADEYFVVGDNRGMTMRDHALGRVDAARIVGRVVF